MDLGAAKQLFGLDLELLQGVLTFLHGAIAPFREIDDPDGEYRLALDVPLLEVRDDTDGYRLGILCTGRLFLSDDDPGSLFETFVRLRPDKAADAGGMPQGVLVFEAIEDVFPVAAEGPITEVFGADGPLGKALDALRLDVFRALLGNLTEQLQPEGTPVDPAQFETELYLGRPASIPRSVYTIAASGGGYAPELDLDVSYTTVPALVATVALAGEDPIPLGEPSIVRPGTGLMLVSTAAMFALRFAIEKAATEGHELEGLTIDRFDATSTDYGFDVSGAGHKTGANVSFDGSLVAQFRGGVGGQLLMRSTIDTDVDSHWWVDLLSVVARVTGVLGWTLGEIFIWEPTRDAPAKVETALLDKFTTPLTDAAQRLAQEFSLDVVPTEAFLADVWFFDGNLGVTAAAFAGSRTASVQAVTHDVAHVSKDPAGAGKHAQRRRPVVSVEEIVLDSGHALKPWQAAKLVDKRLLVIPGHHVVHNALAREGVYLRSDPDDTTADNLLS